jgi:hypothetical protein
MNGIGCKFGSGGLALQQTFHRPVASQTLKLQDSFWRGRGWSSYGSLQSQRIDYLVFGLDRLAKLSASFRPPSCTT